MTPYDVLLCDAPWRWENWSSAAKAVKGEKWGRAMGRPEYDCMMTEDIAALPVAQLCHRDTLLFMWATGPKMEDAFQVMKAWGFEYRTTVFTWAKLTPRALDNWREWNILRHTPEEIMAHLFHAGNGYWCLGGETRVHVCHKKTGHVESVAVRDLVIRDARSYLIHTHQGWKQLKAAWMNGIQPTVELQHRLGTTRCTESHRWAVKRLSAPRNSDGSRGRQHVIEYLTVAKLDELSKRAPSTIKRGSTNLLFGTFPIVSPTPVEEWEGLSLNYDTGC